MYTKVIEWFESTGLYRDLLSKLPSPLNNSVFSGIVVLVLLIIAVVSIADAINMARIRRRIKKKNRAYEEKKLDEKLKAEEEKPQNKEIEKCLQLMMVTQMQNMTSAQEALADRVKKDEIPVEEDIEIHFSPKDCTGPEFGRVSDYLNQTENVQKQ